MKTFKPGGLPTRDRGRRGARCGSGTPPARRGRPTPWSASRASTPDSARVTRTVQAPRRRLEDVLPLGGLPRSSPSGPARSGRSTPMASVSRIDPEDRQGRGKGRAQVPGAWHDRRRRRGSLVPEPRRRQRPSCESTRGRTGSPQTIRVGARASVGRRRRRPARSGPRRARRVCCGASSPGRNAVTTDDRRRRRRHVRGIWRGRGLDGQLHRRHSRPASIRARTASRPRPRSGTPQALAAGAGGGLGQRRRGDHEGSRCTTPTCGDVASGGGKPGRR